MVDEEPELDDVFMSARDLIDMKIQLVQISEELWGSMMSKLNFQQNSLIIHVITNQQIGRAHV